MLTPVSPSDVILAFMMPSSQELIIIAVVVLVLFGGVKLPQFMRGMGEGIREFKKATHGPEPGTDPAGGAPQAGAPNAGA